MKKWMLIVAAGLFVIGCSGKRSYVKKGQVMDTIDQEAVKSTYIESIGIGGAPPDITDTTRRKSLSRAAAKALAEEEMLTMVKGRELEGGIVVERAIETDSRLETRIKESIRGAEVVKTEFTEGEGAVVTLRLPKKRLEEMMGVKFK